MQYLHFCCSQNVTNISIKAHSHVLFSLTKNLYAGSVDGLKNIIQFILGQKMLCSQDVCFSCYYKCFAIWRGQFLDIFHTWNASSTYDDITNLVMEGAYQKPDSDLKEKVTFQKIEGLTEILQSFKSQSFEKIHVVCKVKI